jgi:arginyl-tRNA synthetase
VREKASVIEEIKEAGENYGKPPKDTKFKKILLEFVSANPTGPLTIAHGRQAALGDSLAMILKFYGHSVDKEYYNNDEGVQITTLGKSLLHRVGQLLGRDEFPKEMPENYYQGEYLIDIAKQFISKKGEDRIKKILSSTDGKPLQELFEECRCFARDHIMDGIKKDLADFGVSFDNYYSQEALGKSGKVEKTLEELRKKGFVEEKEGAVWFLSTRFGDDKDRVLVKSDKSYTYLTPDIAYHRDKLERKYESLINILGPDHHGYIARITAAIQAFGYPKEALEIKIAKLVTLFEGDKQLRMSTRAGEFVTLRELLDEVKKDAARFFFLMRRFDAHLDFDLELAKSQTMDNPVFYIQYAYARIENIKGLCAEKKLSVDKINPERFSLLSSVSELQLLRLMRQFPAAVKAALQSAGAEAVYEVEE